MTHPEDKSKEFGHLSSDYDPTRSFGGGLFSGDNPNPFHLRVERSIKRIDPENDPAGMDIAELMEALKPHPILQSLFIETLTDEQYVDYLRSLPSSD